MVFKKKKNEKKWKKLLKEYLLIILFKSFKKNLIHGPSKINNKKKKGTVNQDTLISSAKNSIEDLGGKFYQYPKFTYKVKKSIKEKFIGFENCKKPIHFVLEFLKKKIIDHVILQTKEINKGTFFLLALNKIKLMLQR